MTTDNQKGHLFDKSTISIDWDKYLAARPNYTLSGFYEIIWNHHKSHNGKWSVAYDVAAGPSNVSEVLAKHFERVFVSDSTELYLDVTKRRLGRNDYQQKFEFNLCSAEDLADHHPNNSADIVVTAMAIALMDHQKAIKSFKRILKPGGTLAMWVYGGPIFGAKKDQEIQKVFRKICARGFDQFKPYAGTFWEKTQNTFFNWLDDIGIPEQDWCEVRRLKYNYDKVLCFEDEKDVDFKPRLESNVQKDEQAEKVIDRTFWKKTVNFEWAQDFIDVLSPRKEEYKTPKVLALYKQLEVLMGGPDQLHDLTWPVVLILATKS